MPNPTEAIDSFLQFDNTEARIRSMNTCVRAMGRSLNGRDLESFVNEVQSVVRKYRAKVSTKDSKEAEAK